MTREEKAQEFARNCAEYNNLPIEVEHLLHTAFIAGYNEREDEEKNPWHKTSEELPPVDKVVIVAYDGYTEDCCFNHRSNNPEVKTSENGWCEIGYDAEPTHWMEIPKSRRADL